MKNRILAHRGYWIDPSEKNGRVALRRALEGGFGLETDIRDLDGELVISHDPPKSGDHVIRFSEFMDMYRSLNADGWLALNIKADGLARDVAATLARYNVKNAFVFDMSVPDMRGYLRVGTATFTRQSDIEPDPACYQESAGVWLDGFDIPFSPAAWGIDVLRDGKLMALVSPELHGRDHAQAWSVWRDAFDLATDRRAMICTDLPESAYDFFRISK